MPSTVLIAKQRAPWTTLRTEGARRDPQTKGHQAPAHGQILNNTGYIILTLTKNNSLKSRCYSYSSDNRNKRTKVRHPPRRAGAQQDPNTAVPCPSFKHKNKRTTKSRRVSKHSMKTSFWIGREKTSEGRPAATSTHLHLLLLLPVLRPRARLEHLFRWGKQGQGINYWGKGRV